MTEHANPLVSDRDVDFVLYEILDAENLCKLPAFSDHSRETFDLILQNTRRLARDQLFPAYRPMDEVPARFRDGAIATHPLLKQLYPQLVDLGLLTMSRPAAVGGQQLPLLLSTMAQMYLGAANCAAVGYLGLTVGAAHLIEEFGNDWLKTEFMARLYSGQWAGTMALTEPQAGSSLADVQTTATPTKDGRYLLRGSKIFISGGDQDFTENIVNMTLARIEGAPAGIKGVSLFAVPKRRVENGKLVSNDVQITGAIHKIGWRGLPSVALNFGDHGDCQGWLVGEPNKGISYMFQMMNESRILVGVSGVATASVAYHESLAYARERLQGRPIGSRDATKPQVPIVEHADVRRMLLRQKSIIEGALGLAAHASQYADLSLHATDQEERHRAKLLLDLLTPVVKTFPAERGFEANVLAIQIHGGYGYSSEYLVESWMRDQKLNSLHEGTTGIQGMDLLGRKVVAEAGNALRVLFDEMQRAIDRAKQANVEIAWCERLESVIGQLGMLTATLAESGLRGDVDQMMLHSADYMDAFSVVVIAWQWLLQAAAAREGLAKGSKDAGFYEGKLCAAQYWFATELSRFEGLAELCRSGENSYGRMKDEWF